MKNKWNRNASLELRNSCCVILLILCAYFFSGTYLQAQIDTSFSRTKVTYTDYLSMVGQKNLNYAAEKFNVNLADANIENAKVFPDPVIGFGWFDNGMRRMGMGYGFNSRLETTLEMGGKRRSRIDLANSEKELTNYLLLNYFRNLRADATLFYLTALKNESLLDVIFSSYQTMHRLATSDSIRYKLGSITEIDARQSNVEAGFMLNNVFQSEVVWKMSMIDLGSLIRKTTLDTLIYPTGDFTKFDRDFTLSQLIVEAQNNRADLLAALQNRDISDKMVKLARANRILDLDLYSGVTYASYDYNIVAPTPSFTQVNAGLSIPLKFSNKYAGDLKMAHYSGMQADAMYRQIEIQIQNEVAQAYYNYLAVEKQVQQFNNGLLNGAQKVLEGKIYSYKRGETTLLEVLNAQRTYNDVHQAYHETLYNYAAALVELERAAGIWDINF